MPVQDAIFNTHITVSLPYLLHLPDGYDEDPEKQWPVMLFLHGSGERGDDLAALRNHSLLKVINEKPSMVPFIVVAPQCPLDNRWICYTDALMALLNKVITDYRVDESRVYLTGLSLGGEGTWYLASEYPTRFAAIAPICGRGRSNLGFPDRLQRMAHMPVWVFHGDADDVVPEQESRTLTDALKSYGGNVRYTVYPGVGHDSWTATYNNPALYDWFLEHRIED